LGGRAMTGTHRIACLAVALVIAACRQTVVFERQDGGAGSIADFCLDGDRDSLHYSVRTPQVIVALDRSMAMNAPFGTTTQVAAAVSALGVAAERYQSFVQFGYIEFPGVSVFCQDSQGCCPGDFQGFYGDPASLLSRARRCDRPGDPGCISSYERPTAAALAACRQEYVDRGPTDRGQYVLLVTDGEPTCTGGGEGCAAATMVGNLRNLFIKTFVVALGNIGYDPCLRTMALSGDVHTGTPPFYYSATSPDTLTTTLSDIVGDVASDACHLEIRDGFESQEQVALFVDNVELARGGPDGWEFDDKNWPWITLRGAACRSLIEGPEGSLDVLHCSENQ
jgi:hypothetical protein